MSVAGIGSRYLADTSAFARARHPLVVERFQNLVRRALIAACAPVRLEVLYSARNLREYDATASDLANLDDVPITPDVMARALDVQRALAGRGHHRLAVSDLVIAAAAESAGLTVLHYDAHFEHIAEVSGQPHEWVAPRGSL